jgi:hypothetical protein
VARDVHRRGGLRRHRATDRAGSLDRTRRRAPVRLRRVLHELQRNIEHDDPAGQPGLHPRARPRPLLLRLERVCTTRSPDRRLHVRPRRDRARVRRRRRLGDRHDRPGRRDHQAAAPRAQPQQVAGQQLAA